MLVAVGDARRDGCARILVESRQAGVLSIAIVAVESLQSLVEVDPLARAFDAVLPLVVARGVDAATPLSRAVAAVTAFATADCISLPVDDGLPVLREWRTLGVRHRRGRRRGGRGAHGPRSDSARPLVVAGCFSEIKKVAKKDPLVAAEDGGSRAPPLRRDGSRPASIVVPSCDLGCRRRTPAADGPAVG
jgi:hypothetical protein